MERRRRLISMSLLAVAIAIGVVYSDLHQPKPNDNASTITSNAPSVKSSDPANKQLAVNALGDLAVKGRAPKTGYARDQFGDGWASMGTCTMRDIILARDMTNVVYRSDTDCDVMSGTLNDPYTGKTIQFTRGETTSSAVQIDHVVAISDAWQKGAQQLSAAERAQLGNDPLELLAVDGPANNNKSDGDAATWLPPNKAYRCRYVARQIAVKVKYRLWVTSAEKDAMLGVLKSCPDQVLPVVTSTSTDTK